MNIITMNGACEDYEFDVAELVDGTLAPEKARVVSLHLAGCARCRRWRDEYSSIDARLARALPPPRLPAEFEWRLAARVRSTAPAPRTDTRAVAEREYAAQIAGLRDRLRAATLGSVAGAVATAGCLFAALPVLVDYLRPALDSPSGPAMLGGAAAAVAVAALAWSFSNGVLPGLHLRR
jgi:anti-sigma factor RsiW